MNKKIIFGMLALVFVGIFFLSFNSATWTDDLEEDILSYYKFDENTGSTAFDELGLNDLTLGDSSAWTTGGIINGGINFQDVGDAVSNGTLTGYPSGDTNFSVSLWVNFSSLATDQELFRIGTGGDNTIFWLKYFEGTDKLLAGFQGAANEIDPVWNSTNDDEYHHFVMSFMAGGNLTLWADNGVLESGNVGGAAFNFNAINFGANSAVTGVIDEVAIYERHLNASDVNKLYNNGVGETRTVTVVDPNVTLIYPADGLSTTDREISFNLTVNSTNYNFTNATLYFWDPDEVATTNYSALVTETNFKSLNLTLSQISPETYTWNYETCYQNITDDYCTFENDNRTLIIASFTDNNQTYNSSTYETAVEDFEIGITYISDEWKSISANLIYNGTSYLGTKVGTGNDILFRRTIDIPLSVVNGAQENRTFYWEIVFSDETTSVKQNSTINSLNHTVDPTTFTHCNATYGPPIFVDYKIYDEDSLTIITSSFKGSFDYSLLGSSLFKNTSYQSSVENSTFQFCANPNSATWLYNVDPTIFLNKSGYNDRLFSLNNQVYSNSTTTKNLYLLNESKGSNIIVELKDQGLQPLGGYYVSIDRFYPGINQYITVMEKVTDEFGTFTGKFIENDVKYKFRFYDPDGNLEKETQDVTIACKSSICIMPFVIESTLDNFEQFEEIVNLETSINFDNVTNIFTYSWNDITGETSVLERLLVERISLNGTIVVCNKTSNALSGALTCDISSKSIEIGFDLDGNYVAKSFRRITGSEEAETEREEVRINDPFEIYGKEGLIWAMLLLLTLVGIGSFNPSVGAMLYLVGFIFMGILGIISFTIPIFFGNLTLVVLFIWAFKG